MSRKLIDSFGREINYLRLSLTDRCDLRCTYCMAENMTFLPKKDLLSFEELDQLCAGFIARGIRKIRLTGGEPLVRRDFMQLIKALSRHLKTGAIQDLTLTTNGTQLARFAAPLKAAGVKRINVSLDTLNKDLFAKLTRRDALHQVLAGLEAAKAVGLKVKINVVALKDINEAEIPAMMEWAHGQGFDMTLIEVMPMGEIDEDRRDQYLPLTAIRERLDAAYSLSESAHRTGGPSRYVDVTETGGRLGFITPLTNNFCAGCNRVRVTCTGRIYMCLGQDDFVDLRAALRGGEPERDLDAALDQAMRKKPEKHDFEISDSLSGPAVSRHMSSTGG